ncbi:2-amino-4-hydroxy-6-hydroxymethyldihydropteridine diphosphokinase [Selenomonas sp.]|uniref:2-amino-4-hydroxy-6- hydroxymethyldihydropteridine diphosphokinase n=1 Tax=Selenomonas sp. TaxID=2053611 RepID=UPI002A816183|nr:2-amino-4-hydroxy-6-hydroxymethyldihydropteridine diphosphokinase [Selenomonas sp.]MDY4417050.1 2-amino-4-hydroxy-6-hydroxymethyldihydropteridine diphosphokinase [Selenomonas sp.]
MILSLSIGANLGRRAWALREAIRRIAGLPGTRLWGASSFYETAPWGNVDQPPFLNGAVQVETELTPEAFLRQTQAIEKGLGRVRHEHWGARTIDIDLVYAVECVDTADGAGQPPAAGIGGPDGTTRVIHRNTEELRLPHPYLLERAFVLEPLRELAPALVLAGQPISYWCKKNAAQDVRRAAELADPWPLQMIACVSKTRGIGNGGELLFHIPEDMEFFKRQTKTDGSVVIMGRKTWESLPQMTLEGRENIMVSRHGLPPVPSPPPPQEIERMGKDWPHMWPYMPSNLHEALNLEALSERIEAFWRDQPHRPFWVVGGGEMYRALLPYTRRILLTEVDAAPAADTFFPALDGFALARRTPARTTGVCFAEYLRDEDVWRAARGCP